ncbi:DNA ligase [Paenibacillus sp. N1-5-1-14]|uniref:ATP-dependent DNA ligase n=1 Tax=Paenibacillus radicibacter TaxID=2972488 RepID=UPI002158CAEF|nr:DNA ligase [Paenibacillus radicibacter]MCR8643577.1 DNA ligase [Paenibacillus radicibacter]
MKLPTKPMSPILVSELPQTDEWGFQLKWDGVRILAQIEHGQAQLFSKRLLLKNAVFPEITSMLAKLQGSMLLDGELVVYDNELKRPIFQKILQRERQKGMIRKPSDARYQLIYVPFDLLYWGKEDLRVLPFLMRHERLKQLFPAPTNQLLTTDLFLDGTALWNWVEQYSWEGIVAKRLTSTYHEGKHHHDWLKKKKIMHLDVQIVGYTLRNKQLASLIMEYQGMYCGRVSLGLNVNMKRELIALLAKRFVATGPWMLHQLPRELTKEELVWLAPPFTCTVSGMEWTEGGLLRHPKIVSLQIPT